MAERSWGCQAPEPAPTPPTPLLEEGHNDTLSLQEGVRGKRLLWDRSFDREMYLLAGCRLLGTGLLPCKRNKNQYPLVCKTAC